MEKSIPEKEDNSINSNVFHKLSWKQKFNGEYKLIQVKSIEDKILRDVRKTSGNKNNQEIKIIDNSEKYKIETTVMTEWGLGKITKINEDIAVVRIEGSEVEFPLNTLNTSIIIYVCVLTKYSNFWTEIKAEFDYSVDSLKKKISSICKCHPSQIVMVHDGKKVDKDINIFDLGIYEKDVFLAVIKDPEELSITRGKNHKVTNKQPLFNAIRFEVNQDIFITGLGLFKNNSLDIFYHILIFEEEANNNLKLIFSENKILVKCEGATENPIFKIKISQLEIKENVGYQLHQYLSNTDSNQNIGVKYVNELTEKSTQIKFKFSNCAIQGRHNSTDTEEVMIPVIYFYGKSDN